MSLLDQYTSLYQTQRGATASVWATAADDQLTDLLGLRPDLVYGGSHGGDEPTYEATGGPGGVPCVKLNQAASFETTGEQPANAEFGFDLWIKGDDVLSGNASVFQLVGEIRDGGDNLIDSISATLDATKSGSNLDITPTIADDSDNAELNGLSVSLADWHLISVGYKDGVLTEWADGEYCGETAFDLSQLPQAQYISLALGGLSKLRIALPAFAWKAPTLAQHQALWALRTGSLGSPTRTIGLSTGVQVAAGAVVAAHQQHRRRRGA